VYYLGLVNEDQSFTATINNTIKIIIIIYLIYSINYNLAQIKRG